MKNKAVNKEPVMKVYKAKKKEGDFSLYSNLNPNVDKNTQTVSRKKLIKGIMHSVGFGGHKLADPIEAYSENIEMLIKRNKKANQQ